MARLATGLWRLEKYTLQMADNGVWEKHLEIFIDERILNGWWLTLPILKSIRAGQEQKAATRTWDVKRGLNSKIHLAVDAHGMPVKMVITSGTVADCTQAYKLIEWFDADYILADRGYDSNSFIEYIEEHGMEAEIPPRKNQKIQKEYDHYLYRYRHLVENTFAELNK